MDGIGEGDGEGEGDGDGVAEGEGDGVAVAVAVGVGVGVDVDVAVGVGEGAIGGTGSPVGIGFTVESGALLEPTPEDVGRGAKYPLGSSQPVNAVKNKTRTKRSAFIFNIHVPF